MPIEDIKEVTMLVWNENDCLPLVGYEWFFPGDSFGEEDSKNPGREIRLTVRGLPDVVTTDIVKDRSVFRRSDWCRRFYQLHNLKFGDVVAIKKVADHDYEVYPKVSP